MEVDETTLRLVLREELGGFEKRLDAKFDKRFADSAKYLDEKFESKAATFFGQWTAYLDDRLSEFEQRVDYRLENMETQLHAIIDRLDTDEIERAAFYAQMGRYDTWFKQLARKTKTRLA